MKTWNLLGRKKMRVLLESKCKSKIYTHLKNKIGRSIRENFLKYDLTGFSKDDTTQKPVKKTDRS